MEYTVHKAELNLDKECEFILRSLPEWFGIEESTQNYIESIKSLPTYTARLNDKVIGFVSVAMHHEKSAELYVLGILPKYHHSGIGKSLIKFIEKDLKNKGIVYIQVKTVSPEAGDEAYGKTYQFYRACGFSPLETIKDFWDLNNPCVFMIKNI